MQVSTPNYKSLIGACQPDIVFSQADICIAPPPHSQKRSIKSIERSFIWLLQILVPEGRPQNLFAHMAGSTVAQARTSFAKSLLEPFDEKERLQVPDFKFLDEGISGYSFDLFPLRYSLPEGIEPDPTVMLLKASLDPLPDTKPRVVNGTTDPYQVLRLIREVGIDIFDVQWAFDAAQWGVALDFVFPVHLPMDGARVQKEIGHNLYNAKYAFDNHPLADEFDAEGLRCQCLACSPTFESQPIDHSPLVTRLLRSRGLDIDSDAGVTNADPMKRAFLHHLLLTHEMLGHALLVSHNLAVAEAFFNGIRWCLATSSPEHFERVCDDFINTYNEHGWGILAEGKQNWMKVDKERGKGRLARDKDSLIDDT
jgi:queuine/archaeosine tRNA-ribosyltransferase